MFLNNEWPRITLELNGIEAALSRGISESAGTKGKAHLTVFAPRESDYVPFATEGLPADDDESHFAKLYRVLREFVRRGDLKGPYGENHPAVYFCFEYPSTTLSIPELLEKLRETSVVIAGLEVHFHGGVSVYPGEREKAMDEMRAEVKRALGAWESEVSLIFFPRFDEKPRPPTPEELEETLTRIRAEFDQKTSLRERAIDILLFLPGIVIYGIWSLIERWRTRHLRRR